MSVFAERETDKYKEREFEREKWKQTDYQKGTL